MEIPPKTDVLYDLAFLTRAVTHQHRSTPSELTEQIKKVVYSLQASLIRLGVVSHGSIQRASTNLKNLEKTQRIPRLIPACKGKRP